ncbi:hypothetical protein L1049_005241 [Liquidambar formosana]|uniref:Centromere protein C n=1 Tax=Liquidambar formosana TaxID=63359 RepID=A0AAP0RPK9_LIQFO
MVNEERSSDLVDPLQNYSVLSLFPQTFGDSTHASNPNDPNDVEYLHSVLRTMALRSPQKLLDQAKTIVDSSGEDKNEFVAAKGKENPRGCRPGLGLGRKRARFSLKPNSSQPDVSLEEPSLNIDQLQDPEEFFLAYEKFENAKKELQRQRGGVLMELNQNNPSTIARRRRPGILGRSATYKHRYPLALSNNDETFVSSQETFEQDIHSPSTYSFQKEATDPNVASQESELAGSIAKTETKVNKLLDELLSVNYEDLEGDGALTLLQERLQIKPIDLDKLCLPDLHDIRRNDFKDFGGNLPKPRNSLSDIHNKLKGMSSKTPVKHRQEAESSAHPLASPTPPKSPFASISILRKRILQSNPSHDPFSAFDIDLSPARNSSAAERIDKYSDLVDTGKELGFSGKLKSLILDENETRVANTGSCEVPREDSARRFNNSMTNNLSSLDVGTDVHLSGSVDLRDNVGDSNMDEIVMDDSSSRPEMEPKGSHEVLTEDSARRFNKSVTDNLSSLSVGTDVHLSGSHIDLRDNVGDSNMDDIVMDDTSSRPETEPKDHSSPTTTEHHAEDGPSKTLDSGSEEQHIERIEEPSRIILNEQSKEKTPPHHVLNKQSKVSRRPRKEHKRKELSRRQSLAGAGMFWESGVRRSTRIKTRPLEYWKGERFLYGRIHQSLATVIGLKYISPAKGDGKAAIKVKSYVSDEHKELVELAALH